MVLRAESRFAPNSPLEEAGFETLVPRDAIKVSRTADVGLCLIPSQPKSLRERESKPQGRPVASARDDGCESARAEEQDDEAVDGRYKGRSRYGTKLSDHCLDYERCPDLPSPVLAATMVAEDVGGYRVKYAYEVRLQVR